VNKITIELAAPPALTAICWFVSRVLTRVQRGKVKPMTWAQFWLLLISAYLMLALALWGGSLLASHEREDLSPELVR
jgi:ABC-type nickel/cobalt efflux system permease component RcnA